MPHVRNEGAEIYWEAHGSGVPVLLIMGLSFTHEMWFRLLPELAGNYRAILFDNRGVGRSSVPRKPYTMARMARDAVAVLRASGESSAHVIGASMGGMIAQELTLRYPDLVRSLVLGCTTHSGLFGRWPDFRCMPRTFGSDRIERERSMINLLYASTTPRERIEEDIRIRCASDWCSRGFLNQLAGILIWSSYRRLPRIHKHTLVLHGDRDRLVPAENGRAVATRIQGARFELVKDAGHVMMTDQPEICTELTLEFLGRVANE